MTYYYLRPNLKDTHTLNATKNVTTTDDSKQEGTHLHATTDKHNPIHLDYPHHPPFNEIIPIFPNSQVTIGRADFIKLIIYNCSMNQITSDWNSTKPSNGSNDVSDVHPKVNSVITSSTDRAPSTPTISTKGSNKYDMGSKHRMHSNATTNSGVNSASSTPIIKNTKPDIWCYSSRSSSDSNTITTPNSNTSMMSSTDFTIPKLQCPTCRFIVKHGAQYLSRSMMTFEWKSRHEDSNKHNDEFVQKDEIDELSSVSKTKRNRKRSVDSISTSHDFLNNTTDSNVGLQMKVLGDKVCKVLSLNNQSLNNSETHTSKYDSKDNNVQTIFMKDDKSNKSVYNLLQGDVISIHLPSKTSASSNKMNRFPRKLFPKSHHGREKDSNSFLTINFTVYATDPSTLQHEETKKQKISLLDECSSLARDNTVKNAPLLSQKVLPLLDKIDEDKNENIDNDNDNDDESPMLSMPSFSYLNNEHSNPDDEYPNSSSVKSSYSFDSVHYNSGLEYSTKAPVSNTQSMIQTEKKQMLLCDLTLNELYHLRRQLSGKLLHLKEKSSNDMINNQFVNIHNVEIIKENETERNITKEQFQISLLDILIMKKERLNKHSTLLNYSQSEEHNETFPKILSKMEVHISRDDKRNSSSIKDPR